MNTTRDKLAKYKQKRDFQKTPEPGDDSIEFTWAEGQPIFVIQKHAASNLHYDFRMEVDGVLKSWAVPKGPSTDPSIRRLAVPTEDHPLGYANFEGVIPEGEYGAGAILVWDRGTYRNLKEFDNQGVQLSIEDQLKNGHITIWLEGEKIRGGYALIRTGDLEDSRWLLIKMDDEGVDARRNPTSTQPESILTGRTIEGILKEESDPKD